jgi:large subunit ribosomal protein L9
MPVTAANKAMIDKERKAQEARLAKEKSEFEALAARIGGLRFVAPRKVGENELLYGSVTSGDVAEFLKAKGIEIDKRRVLLDEPVKHLGEHEVKIRLHPEVQASLRLLVTKEG